MALLFVRFVMVATCSFVGRWRGLVVRGDGAGVRCGKESWWMRFRLNCPMGFSVDERGGKRLLGTPPLKYIPYLTLLYLLFEELETGSERALQSTHCDEAYKSAIGAVRMERWTINPFSVNAKASS